MIKSGSCHCGKVRFEIDSKVDSAMSCNCSICQRKGTLLTFIPIDKFKLISGNDFLVDYQFGQKSIHHYFCSICGVTSFAAGHKPDGSEIRAINVRCLDEINIELLKVTHYDGKKI